MRNIINYPLIDDVNETYVEKTYVAGPGVGGGMQSEFGRLEDIKIFSETLLPFDNYIEYAGPGYYADFTPQGERDNRLIGKWTETGEIVADVYDAGQKTTYHDVKLKVLEFASSEHKLYITDLTTIVPDVDTDINTWAIRDDQYGSPYVLTDGYWVPVFYVSETKEGWKVTSVNPGVAYCKENQVVMYNGDGGQSVPAFEFIWSGPEKTKVISWSDFGFTSDVFNAYVEMFMKKNTTLSEYNVKLRGGSLPLPIVPGTISYSQERYITFSDYTPGGQGENIEVTIDAVNETISIKNMNIFD